MWSLKLIFFTCLVFFTVSQPPTQLCFKLALTGEVSLKLFRSWGPFREAIRCNFGAKIGYLHKNYYVTRKLSHRSLVNIFFYGGVCLFFNWVVFTANPNLSTRQATNGLYLGLQPLLCPSPRRQQPDCFLRLELRINTPEFAANAKRFSKFTPDKERAPNLVRKFLDWFTHRYADEPKCPRTNPNLNKP